MKNTTKKKIITIGDFVKRSIIQSSGFFLCLISWQVFVFLQNLNSKQYANPMGLFLLLAAIVFLVCSYFEIRTITQTEERFLGYKGYLLFYYKFLMIPLLVLLTYGVSKFTENILILVSLQSVFAGIYFLILFLSFRKYKNAIKEHEKIYICYEKRIKKWYVEGKI